MSGAEKLVGEVSGCFPNLFIYLPSELRNKYELAVGDALVCSVSNFYSSEKVSERAEDDRWHIEGYWNELHIPRKIAEKYRVETGDKLEITIKGIVRQNGSFEELE